MTRFIALCLAVSAVFAGSIAMQARQPADGPQYMGDRLVRPDYREWVFVSSGLGMAYGPDAVPGQPPLFTNVFVNPRSYRQFLQTGAWPDQTMFVLEIRRAATERSINRGGSFQDELVGIEAEVKDSRFPGNWRFFGFGRGGVDTSAAALPDSASCYTCHKANAAVENTFVQFYPTLMSVARQKGTVNPGYREEPLPAR